MAFNFPSMNLNFLDNFNEMKERKHRLKSFPFKIYLESTQKCNLNCIMCDRNSYSPENREFPLDLLKKIKTPLKKADEVLFHFFGEPLLSKNLFRLIDETIKINPHFTPKIFTNGTILNEEILEKLDERGVFVSISFETTNPRLYEKIRRGASFRIFKNNIKRYAERYKNRKNDRFHVRLSCAMAIGWINEAPKIVRFAKKYGIREILFMAINTNKEKKMDLELDSEKAIKYFKKAKKLADKYKIRFSCPFKIGEKIIWENNNLNDFRLPVDKYSPLYLESYNPNPITNDCPYPWIETIIRANGDVVSCCQGRHVMGNLHKSNFNEIWNNKKYQQLRAQTNFKQCMASKCNVAYFSIGPCQIWR
jgi:radical SAM protein with 4Fe4S-binding SPASM domain